MLYQLILLIKEKQAEKVARRQSSTSRSSISEPKASTKKIKA
jgi:hypothetical protein